MGEVRTRRKFTKEFKVEAAAARNALAGVAHNDVARVRTAIEAEMQACEAIVAEREREA